MSRFFVCFLMMFPLARFSFGQGPPTLPVVPAVQQWHGAEGRLALASDGAIEVNSADASALAGISDMLREDLADAGLKGVAIRQARTPGAAGIFLALGKVAGVEAAHLDEAYQLDIAQTVRITATGPRGLFYGTRTLLQLLRQSADHSLPCGQVIDFPGYSGRMLMIDVARKPFPVPVLKDFIRMMSWYKMNELHLHLSDDSGGYSAFRVESKKFPGLASKDLFYTWEDLRDLQDFARARAVTITPEIDMPGHAGSLTAYWPALRHPRGLLGKDKLDVTNPKTAETMKALLDEMIPLFDAPDFHIGTDEFGIGGTKEQRLEIGEDFRRFINTINTYVRSKGKNCRIWSGFESMPGTTLPDLSVTIDMWVTRDARSLIDQGHSVINSSDGRTYIVPGAHYYGVNNAGTYQGWEPYKVSDDPAKNPMPGDPHFLGGKLHIWNDQGPSGYTLTEIADLSLPSIQAFGEKLWGTKGSASYREFQRRAALTGPVPGVSIFQRDPAVNADGIVFQLDGEKTLSDAKASIPLPWANNPPAALEYSKPLATPSRADLEVPWTLSMKVRQADSPTTRGVILSSDLVEICANYTKEIEVKEKGADGTVTKHKVKTQGLGMVRAAGSFGQDPHSASYAYDTDGVAAAPLPINQWVDVSIVGLPRQTLFYVNGQLAGKLGNQMVCPLKHIGSVTGNSFVGSIKDLHVWDRDRSAQEIGRAAGLDIPENLAARCSITATRTDGDFLPEYVTDGDASTRWSSGGGQTAAITIDLGKAQSFDAVTIQWEHAYAKKYDISVSADGAAWGSVYAGEGRDGETLARFPLMTGRFVRITGLSPATPYGYSIWEAEVCRMGPDVAKVP